MTNHTDDYRRLHETYTASSGRTMTFDIPAMFNWERWALRGWTENDLKLVIQFIKAKIAKKKRQETSLRLHNLIDPARFEDDLQDAQQWARKQATGMKAAKAAILAAVGRPVQEDKHAVQVSEIVSTLKTPEQMKEFFAKCKRDAGL